MTPRNTNIYRLRAEERGWTAACPYLVGYSSASGSSWVQTDESNAESAFKHFTRFM